MCQTKWCYGDCDECEREAELAKQFAEANAECPYRQECIWNTIDAKTDKCTTCGKVTNY